MVDKKKALETAIAQIDKQYGKGTVMRLGEHAALNIEAIPTGSVSLDIALGIGGVPRGRIIEIYGPESSGKTTLALHIVAEAQKKAQIIQGQGDKPAAHIWAKASARDKDFYAFYRSLEAYKNSMTDGKTAMVLSPDSEFFKFFKALPAGVRK